MTGKVGRPLGSRKKTIRTVKPTITKTGVEVEKCYCRKCRKEKNPVEFFDAVDIYIDTNGKMSVCKDCCDEIYARMYQSEHDFAKAILRVCRILNIRYSPDAVESAESRLKKKHDDGKETEHIFGLYKASLSVTQKTRITARNVMEDMTFIEPNIGVSQNLMADDDVENGFDIKQFWGDSFEYDDYVFLERELSEWKKTHKADTKAEETLLKELCYKNLEIRKARVEGRSTASLVKELQDLMKTASVDPAKTAIAGSGKSQDTFSSFIKTIEENEPAEFYKDRKLFKDFDNIGFYFRKYVTRPLRNFVTQSRDFNVETDNDDDDFLMDDVPLGKEFEDGDITPSLQE